MNTKTAMQILAKITGEECMYIEHGMVRGGEALEAMEEYASQFKHPVPDESQPASGYSREQMLVCHLAGQEDAGCKHPSLSDAQAYVTLSLPASQPEGDGWVSCRHEWKYNRTICVKVCVKCNYAENYSL